MEYFINDRLQMVPNASKEEMEAMYMSERLKRKVHKKGPAPKLLGNERCEICGHLANGFHYNVLRNVVFDCSNLILFKISTQNTEIELCREYFENFSMILIHLFVYRNIS
jgi:hypothetical protein